MESALSIDEQARYLEISPGLLEYVPDILKYLDQLGPSPKEVYQLVKKLSLPPNSQILDLGSGKGAISNYLAQNINCSITGIDSFGPFVEYANTHSPDNKAKYYVKDIRKELAENSKYDLIIYVSVDYIDNDLAKTLELIRNKLKPGGYYILEAMYLKNNKKNRSKLYDAPDYHSHHNIMELSGSKLISQKVYTHQETVSLNKYFLRKIKQGIEEISGQKPELKSLLDEYYSQQEYESECINNDFEISLAAFQLAK